MLFAPFFKVNGVEGDAKIVAPPFKVVSPLTSSVPEIDTFVKENVPSQVRENIVLELYCQTNDEFAAVDVEVKLYKTVVVPTPVEICCKMLFPAVFVAIVNCGAF